MASPATSIPDTALGLSHDEVQLLRRHQQVALSQHGGSSSRAGSQASSQGLLLLDPGSLRALSWHFDQLMAAIQNRVQMLSQQTMISTQTQSRHAGNAMAQADAEIARFREILRQIDELEVEFDKVRRIQEIVKGFRARVESLERRMGR